MPKRKTPVGSTFSHKTRERLSRRLQRVSQSPRLQRFPRLSRVVVRVSNAVKPKDRHAAIAHAARFFKNRRFFTSDKHFKRSFNLQSGIAGAMFGTVVSVPKIGILNAAMVSSGIMGIQAINAANLWTAKRLSTEYSKLLSKLINKPVVGKKVAEKIKDKNTQDDVLAFSQTKFIPKQEVRQLVEDAFSRDGQKSKDAIGKLVVARRLCECYIENPALTSQIGSILFAESASFLKSSGNNHESRSAFLSVVQTAQSIYKEVVSRKEMREIDLTVRIHIKCPETKIKIVIDGRTGNFTLSRVPRIEDN